MKFVIVYQVPDIVTDRIFFINLDVAITASRPPKNGVAPEGSGFPLAATGVVLAD